MKLTRKTNVHAVDHVRNICTTNCTSCAILATNCIILQQQQKALRFDEKVVGFVFKIYISLIIVKINYRKLCFIVVQYKFV